MKRFDEKDRSKDRDAPAGTRSGPRARAAQDRKFGAVRAKPRAFTRDDPYQRAERPPRLSPARDAPPHGERLRAPARDGAIALDPDVARVFRDSEAVNEALRLVIRLARTIGGGARPAFNRTGAPAGPRSVPRSGPPSGARSRAPSDRFAREERPRRTSTPPVRREPKFEESE